MKRLRWIVFPTLLFTLSHAASGDTFGSGANSFQIDFVTVGNAGNAPDITGNPNPAGSVPYEYRIGKYEISEQMIDKANALGGLGITKDTRGPDKPATSISWYEVARFVNWLNTSSGSPPAYKFDASDNFQLWIPTDPGYNPNNLYRNSLAKYALPSDDEWYKAAYYDPKSNVYYDYPTGSDDIPDGIDFIGDPVFDAVIPDLTNRNDPNDITNAGKLSPYGTAGQGGNVYEWEETDYDLLNDAVLSARGLRGGSFLTFYGALSSSAQSYDNPLLGDPTFGFRVASTSAPEPSPLVLLGSALTLMSARRRLCSSKRHRAKYVN